MATCDEVFRKLIRRLGAGAPRTRRERAFDRQMARCQAALRSGVPLAVADAVACCIVYRQPPPEWLAEAVAVVIRQSAPKKKRQRHFLDLVHYARWDAVQELIDRAAEFAERNDSRARSAEERYEAVSSVLAGTVAAGDPKTIERSYLIVEKAMKSEQTGRFFLSRFAPPV